MKDMPILFAPPMVRALLDGRKTMTRRLAFKPITPSRWHRVEVGDRIWVREGLQRVESSPPTAQYAATKTGVPAPAHIERHPNGAALWKWSKRSLPSIYMPRWASRLTLVVTGTKVERLQSISTADCYAEGFKERPDLSDDPQTHIDAAHDWFSDLWVDLNGADSWRANPEVVAISFEVHKYNIDTPAPMRRSCHSLETV